MSSPFIRFSRYFSVFGLVFLGFGILAIVLDVLQRQEPSLIAFANLGAGLVLVLLYVVFNLNALKTAIASRSAKHGANAIVYVIIFIGIIVAVNVISVTEPTFAKKWDLTANSVYTLSDQTTKLLKDLEEDVRVWGFYNAGAPERTQLKELIDRYRYYSSKVTLDFYDADERPDLAKQYDVQNGVTLVQYGRNKTKVANIQEQEITNALIQVTKKGEKSVYFLTGHQEGGIDAETQNGFSYLKSFIENEGYLAKTLNLVESPTLPTDCSVLVILAPKSKLSDIELAKLEQFSDAGGNIFYLLEPTLNHNRSGISETGLEKFLRKVGVELDQDIVFNKVEVPPILARLVGNQVRAEVVVDRYEQHPITESYDRRTIFGFTRTMTYHDGTGYTIKPLVKINASNYWAETNIPSIMDRSVARDERDKTGELVIGVALEKEGADANQGKSVILGNASFVSNARIAANSTHLDFFLNSLNWLMGEEKKISIRPRRIKASKLTWTPKEARTIFYLSVLMIPQALLLFGLGVWQWRRKR